MNATNGTDQECNTTSANSTNTNLCDRTAVTTTDVATTNSSVDRICNWQFVPELVCDYKEALAGSAAFILIATMICILICLRKCCCSKSAPDTEDDCSKQEERAEAECGETLNIRSCGHLDNNKTDNIYHALPSQEFMSESPYEEMKEPADTASGNNLYAEVRVVNEDMAPSGKKRTTYVQEVFADGSTTAMILPGKADDIENEYDDAVAIKATRNLSGDAAYKNNIYELATKVDDAVVAPVDNIYDDAVMVRKDQKPINYFALNYAVTIQSLTNKLKTPTIDLEADNVNNLYEEAAVFKANETKSNGETQCDDASDVYEEAAAVRFERVVDTKQPNVAHHCRVRQSNSFIPTEVNRKKNEVGMQFMVDELTLVENSLYGDFNA